MPGPPQRISFQRWGPVVIFLLACCAPTRTADAQSDHKQVLVLYSTRRDAEFSLVGESELPRTLEAGLGSDLDYYSEFIDITRFPDPIYKTAFHDFLRQKYQNIRFDLVIAMQEAAIAFVNGNRETLFADTPAVFLTNTSATKRPPNSTGLIHERNFTATLALLRQLQPDVQQVFIVTGAAPADKAYEAAVRRQVQASEMGVTVTYLSGLATPDLEARLSTLPEHSAVYYVLVTEDGSSHKFHPLDYVDRVAAAANAPTYCWVDSAMDHGIVGGSLYSQRGAIHRVGDVALRVLRGEAANSIPMARLNLNSNQVDWRQLQRWGIDGARVPADTLVKFREPTVWDRYRIYILGALAVLGTQSVLIAGLLIQRNRRRRAEQKLRASQDALRKSYERNRDLAARLLQAQETERSRIARELHDDICQRMLLLTMALESSRGGDGAEQPTEALSIAQDIARSLHELSHRLHPARLRMIGLIPALDRLCVETSRAGIDIAYTHANVPSVLPPEVMLCLFRVVQEGLHNAIKYSDAKTLSVDVSGNGDGLTLTIEDNGVGFDVDTAWGKGVGLVSMVERLEAIGGSLDIRSHPGGGTHLQARVPVRS